MSNALEAASLIMVPSGYEDGTLASVKPNDGTGDFTFSRGSNLSATRINEQGYIDKGYENLLLQSNQFDTTWTNFLIDTPTSGQAGYDGTNNAWLIECINTSNFNGVRQSISTTGVTALSVYAKAGTTNFLGFFSSAGFGGFELIGAGTTGQLFGNAIDSKIELISNGWYRCSIVLNGNVSAVFIGARSSINSFNANIGDSVYIQDAMLNQGLAAYPYIETTTAPVAGGILEDMPRLDWASGAPSLLLEPSRTNLANHSELISSQVPRYMNNIVDVTYTPCYGISPEGAKNSTRVQFADTTAFAYKAVSLSEDNTGSLYVKGTAGEDIRFGFGTTVAQGGVIHTFDGTWQRITHTSSTGVQFYLSSYTYTGNQALDFEIYGLQHEIGSYPTSYIPTYGVSQTRLQDSCNVSGLAQSFPFTAYIEIDVFSTSVYNQFQFRQDPSNYVLRVGNQIRVGAGSVLANTLGFNKIALSVDAFGNFELFRNGTSLSTGTITGSIDEIRSGTAGYEVKEIILFPTALSDEECIQLTTV